MKCKFVKAWIGECGVEDCKEHADIKCCVCGATATHTCDATGGFVCGAPLCDGCEHKLDKEGTNGWMCGGGHCKKGEQEFHSWIIQGFIDDHKEEVDEMIAKIKAAKRDYDIEELASLFVLYKTQLQKKEKELCEKDSH